MSNAELINVSEFLVGLEAKLDNTTAFIEAVGVIVAASNRDNFANERDPNPPYSQWEGLKERTIRERAEQGLLPTPILFRKGALRDSITSVLNSARSVSVGSPIPYSHALHAGADDLNLVARPFLGIGAKDELTIWAILAKQLGLD